MTRNNKATSSPAGKPRRAARDSRTSHWALQDAKAHFSELVRRAHSDGPQHVTVRGRQEVVIISADEFHRMKGDRSGDALIAAMQASPHRDIEISPLRTPLPVRDVSL